MPRCDQDGSTARADHLGSGRHDLGPVMTGSPDHALGWAQIGLETQISLETLSKLAREAGANPDVHPIRMSIRSATILLSPPFTLGAPATGASRTAMRGVLPLPDWTKAANPCTASATAGQHAARITTRPARDPDNEWDYLFAR
jgi:hypothetical protein